MSLRRKTLLILSLIILSLISLLIFGGQYIWVGSFARLEQNDAHWNLNGINSILAWQLEQLSDAPSTPPLVRRLPRPPARERCRRPEARRSPSTAPEVWPNGYRCAAGPRPVSRCATRRHTAARTG